MRNARHIMDSYRHFIVGTKRRWNAQIVSAGRMPVKQAARGLVHYRGYVDAYLEAKRAVLAGRDSVDA